MGSGDIAKEVDVRPNTRGEPVFVSHGFHEWTQIPNYGSATNTTVTIYTVTASKLARLTLLIISYQTTGAGSFNAGYYNSAGVLIKAFVANVLPANVENEIVIPFTDPLEMSSLESIRIYSSAAGVSVRGFTLCREKP